MKKLKQSQLDILVKILSQENKDGLIIPDEVRKTRLLPENRDYLKTLLDSVGNELGEKGFDGDSPNKYGYELEDIISILSSALIDLDRKSGN